MLCPYGQSESTNKRGLSPLCHQQPLQNYIHLQKLSASIQATKGSLNNLAFRKHFKAFGLELNDLNSHPNSTDLFYRFGDPSPEQPWSTQAAF